MSLLLTLPVAFSLQFVADQNIPLATEVDHTELGGLSGLSYDEASGQLLAVSDDKGEGSTPRFYTFNVRVDGGPILDLASAKATAMALDPLGVDPEGIARLSADRIFVSSEGNQRATPRVRPGVFELKSDGSVLRPLDIPADFFEDEALDPTHGVRDNQAFEGLSLTPDKKFLFVGTEAALIQDGPEIDFEHGGDVRILRYRLDGEQRVLDAQFRYHVEPVFRPDGLPGAVAVDNGLSELLALSATELLVLERGGVKDQSGVFHTHVVLFHVTITADGTVWKEKVLDFDDLIPRLSAGFQSIDNLEGMTFGPRLKNGHRSLIVISDDNFRAPQRTQVLLFDVTD